jgi:hypothetical protein
MLDQRDARTIHVGASSHSCRGASEWRDGVGPCVSWSLRHTAGAVRIARPLPAAGVVVRVFRRASRAIRIARTHHVRPGFRAHARPSVCTSLVGCPCLAACGDERDARRASGGGVSLRGGTIVKQRRDNSVRADPSRNDQRAWALIRLSRARRRNTPSWTVNWAGGALGRVDTRRSAARSCRASI